MILQASTLLKNQTGYISFSILLILLSISPKKKRDNFADISFDTLLILLLSVKQNCYHQITGVAILVGCFNRGK